MNEQQAQHKSMSVEKMVYNVPEIAVMLNIDVTSAYQLARRKGFPAIKVGKKRIIVPKVAFHRWLESAPGNE